MLKIQAAKVEITFSEESRFAPETFEANGDTAQLWRDVDFHTFQIGQTRRNGGYAKTAFRITFADGEVYQGQLDAHPGNTSIRAHARRFMEVHTGRDVPSDPEQLNRRVAYLRACVKPADRATMERFLDHYDFGGA